MSEIWIKLIPNDTLFFRTGRPFTMGSENWSDVIFPPYPSTIYGALRTFLLFHREGNLSSFYYPDIGSPNQKGSLQLYGPILCEKENTSFFPIPLDLVAKKDGKDNNALILSKIRKPTFFFSDYKLENLLFYKREGQIDNIDGFLDDITLMDYLTCKVEGREFQYVKRKNFYTYETKIGIAREKTTLTSKEGHLYRIPMIRLKDDVGILVKISGIAEDIPQEGILQLGGEAKTTYYERLNENPLKLLNDIELNFDNKIFKLYLATPAIFKKGWIPEWINEDTMTGTYKNQVNLKLISCVIGKYVRVGGWDMAKNKPKPMYKAVPAGSVYYFEVLENIPTEKIKELFHLKNISDINPEEGFGLTLIGGLP